MIGDKLAGLGDELKIPATFFWVQSHMQSFTTKIVDMMKEERFFSSQGGHIILAQVLIPSPLRLMFVILDT